MKYLFISMGLAFLAVVLASVSVGGSGFGDKTIPMVGAVYGIGGLLLSLCIVPWMKGQWSQRWLKALKFGIPLAFGLFNMGYLLIGGLGIW